MLRKNDNLILGLNKLCDGEKDGMFMDIYLLKGEAGKSYTFENPTQETYLRSSVFISLAAYSITSSIVCNAAVS